MIAQLSFKNNIIGNDIRSILSYVHPNTLTRFRLVSVETGRKTISLPTYFLPKASNAGDS